MSRIDYIEAKIVTPEVAKRNIGIWKMRGEEIVFTNGCFDILHRGHVTYLAKAASLGKRLIVAINSDESVREQNKGPERPINDEYSRQILIASLGFVDQVILFNKQTPLELIEYLTPDILVKGADYDANETDPTSKKHIVGSDHVLKNGGKVSVIELEDGFSTTGLVKKLKA